MKDAVYPSLRETRWAHIISTLEKTRWDIKEASILLRVSERYLRNEIRKMGRRGTKSGEGKRKETIQQIPDAEDL
jgi:hypothetical protein